MFDDPAPPGFASGGQGGIPSVTNLSATQGTNVGSVRLNWVWPEALVAGASYYIEYSTNSGHSFSTTTAQVVKATGPVTGGSPTSFAVGGLDVGFNNTNSNVSPTYHFRLWITTGPGAFSNASNPASSQPQAPAAFNRSNTDFGGEGTPGGGFLETTFMPGNSEEKALAVAYSASAIYITGRYFNGLSTDVFVRKYNSGGGTEWTRYYNSPSNENDEGRGIAVSGGNVYVTGFETRNDLGQGRNIFAFKLNSSGVREWFISGSAVGDDEGNGVALTGHATTPRPSSFQGKGKTPPSPKSTPTGSPCGRLFTTAPQMATTRPSPSPATGRGIFTWRGGSSAADRGTISWSKSTTTQIPRY